MTQSLCIVSLFAALGAVGASSSHAAASGVPKQAAQLIHGGDVMKIFGYYDKNNDGTLSTAEEESFLQDIQNYAGVHLPAKDLNKVKSEKMTIEQFESSWTTLVHEIQTVQQRRQQEQQMRQQRQQQEQQELQRDLQSGDTDRLFAHYDKDRNGTLDSTEQDQFLDDLQEMYRVHLPARFRNECKTGVAMTPEKFKMVYAKMAIEFQNLQQKAEEDQEKSELKKEFSQLSPHEQKAVGKMYGISVPHNHSADLQEEMLEDGAQQPSGIFTDIVVFSVAAVASAAMTTYVIRKASPAPERDSYLMLNA